MIRAALAMAVVAACGRDVRLGTAVDAAVDGAPDSNGNPFGAGAYAMAVLDPPQQMCQGTLTGMEPAFAGITRASLGLIDGAVTFDTPTATSLAITGSPITSALGTGAITITPDASNPPGLWDGLVSGDFSAGPASTTRNATDLAADSTTSQPIQAQLAVLYETLDTMGACTVAFGVSFTQ
jgi:hypothetical protein